MNSPEKFAARTRLYVDESLPHATVPEKQKHSMIGLIKKRQLSALSQTFKSGSAVLKESPYLTLVLGTASRLQRLRKQEH